MPQHKYYSSIAELAHENTLLDDILLKFFMCCLIIQERFSCIAYILRAPFQRHQISSWGCARHLLCAKWLVEVDVPLLYTRVWHLLPLVRLCLLRIPHLLCQAALKKGRKRNIIDEKKGQKSIKIKIKVKIGERHDCVVSEAQTWDRR